MFGMKRKVIKLDLTEDEEKIIITAILSQVKKKDIKVKYNDSSKKIIISISCKSVDKPNGITKKISFLKENHFINLPCQIDPNTIETLFESDKDASINMTITANKLKKPNETNKDQVVYINPFKSKL